MDLDLDASPEQVVHAAAEVTQRAGGTVERVESAAAPGGGYRVVTRSADRPDEPGPVVLVYDVAAAGGGVTRVRIVQCGFGEQAVWDDAFGRWRGWTIPAPADILWSSLGNLPADRSGRDGARPLPWGSFPPLPSGVRWPGPVPALASVLGAGARSGDAQWAGAAPALVDALERAGAGLLALRTSGPTRPRGHGVR